MNKVVKTQEESVKELTKEEWQRFWRNLLKDSENRFYGHNHYNLKNHIESELAYFIRYKDDKNNLFLIN